MAAASPASESTQRFDAHASQTLGARAVMASAAVMAAGRGSHSTRTRSAPSRAAAGVSATTIATGSPTKRARSVGRGECGAMKNGEPSQLVSGTSCGLVGTGRCGIATRPSWTASAPVRTAMTPAVFSASPASMLRMAAWACGERTMHA